MDEILAKLVDARNAAGSHFVQCAKVENAGRNDGDNGAREPGEANHRAELIASLTALRSIDSTIATLVGVKGI